MGIDAAIQRVTLSHIVFGKTVETADQIARLCFAYQDENYTNQVEKHLKILLEHTKGRPGARMEINPKLQIVKTKIDLIQAQFYLSKGQSPKGMVL